MGEFWESQFSVNTDYQLTYTKRTLYNTDTSSSINSNSGGTPTFLSGWGGVSGHPWLGCENGITGMVCGCGGWLAALGSNGCRGIPCCPVLAPCPLGVIQSYHWEVFFILGVCCQCWWGCFINVRCQQTPLQNGRNLKSLGVKGESWLWAAV